MSAESSTAEEMPQVEGTEATNNSDAVNPPSSSSGTEGQDTEASIVDAVTAALRPKTEGEGSPSSQTPDSSDDSGKSDAEKAESEELPEEVTEEELSQQKPKTRKRIEQLLGKVRDLSSEAETLRPKAQEFDRIVSFIAANKLTSEDLDSGFEIMALMKKNPVAAFEKLKPIVAQLATLAGEVLPADLQERVRLGYISEQDARELHRARTRETLARSQTEQAEAQAAQQREAERRRGIVREVSSSVAQWEAGKKTSDPDWHLKAARINELVRLEVYENGYPQTKEDAVKLMNTIYDRVTKEVRKFVPKPQEKQPVSGQSSPTVVAEPKSFLEAVRMGLNR